MNIKCRSKTIPHLPFQDPSHFRLPSSFRSRAYPTTLSITNSGDRADNSSSLEYSRHFGAFLFLFQFLLFKIAPPTTFLAPMPSDSFQSIQLEIRSVPTKPRHLKKVLLSPCSFIHQGDAEIDKAPMKQQRYQKEGNQVPG